MPTFISLTSLGDGSRALVNLDHVTHISVDGRGRTVVPFQGDFDAAVKVEEAPEEIAAMTGAPRP